MVQWEIQMVDWLRLADSASSGFPTFFLGNYDDEGSGPCDSRYVLFNKWL